MKAISVRAPWWWYILHGGKDIENRSRKTNYRGPLLIHASGYWNVNEICETIRQCSDITPVRFFDPFTTTMRPKCGMIVGKVDLVDCVEASDSPWFYGPFGYVLENPVTFYNPVPCRGQLGIFNAPDDDYA